MYVLVAVEPLKKLHVGGVCPQKKENISMNVYLIIYSEQKDQCCPPSSYRQVNEKTVLADSEQEAIAQLTGKNIEIKSITKTN